MRKDTGFSLLEVLIALVVILVGVLGIAALQLMAINNTAGVNYQNLAAQLASGISAQMQANTAYWGTLLTSTTPVPVTQPNGIGSAEVNITSTTQSLAQAGNALDCVANTCSAIQLAEYDEDSWRNILQNGFPGANRLIKIDCITSTPVTCVVEVDWQVANVAINVHDQQAMQTQQAQSTSMRYTTIVTIPLAGI